MTRPLNERESVVALFNSEVDQSADLMSELIKQLSQDVNLQEVWAEKDRPQLLSVTEDLFNYYRESYDISHLYFVETNLNCFLRIHKPDRYGDNLNWL